MGLSQNSETRTVSPTRSSKVTTRKRKPPPPPPAPPIPKPAAEIDIWDVDAEIPTRRGQARKRLRIAAEETISASAAVVFADDRKSSPSPPSSLRKVDHSEPSTRAKLAAEAATRRMKSLETLASVSADRGAQSHKSPGKRSTVDLTIEDALPARADKVFLAKCRKTPPLASLMATSKTGYHEIQSTTSSSRARAPSLEVIVDLSDIPAPTTVPPDNGNSASLQFVSEPSASSEMARGFSKLCESFRHAPTKAGSGSDIPKIVETDFRSVSKQDTLRSGAQALQAVVAQQRTASDVSTPLDQPPTPTPEEPQKPVELENASTEPGPPVEILVVPPPPTVSHAASIPAEVTSETHLVDPLKVSPTKPLLVTPAPASTLNMPKTSVSLDVAAESSFAVITEPEMQLVWIVPDSAEDGTVKCTIHRQAVKPPPVKKPKVTKAREVTPIIIRDGSVEPLPPAVASNAAIKPTRSRKSALNVVTTDAKVTKRRPKRKRPIPMSEFTFVLSKLEGRQRRKGREFPVTVLQAPLARQIVNEKIPGILAMRPHQIRDYALDNAISPDGLAVLETTDEPTPSSVVTEAPTPLTLWALSSTHLLPRELERTDLLDDCICVRSSQPSEQGARELDIHFTQERTNLELETAGHISAIRAVYDSEKRSRELQLEADIAALREQHATWAAEHLIRQNVEIEAFRKKEDDRMFGLRTGRSEREAEERNRQSEVELAGMTPVGKDPVTGHSDVAFDITRRSFSSNGANEIIELPSRAVAPPARQPPPPRPVISPIKPGPQPFPLDPGPEAEDIYPMPDDDDAFAEDMAPALDVVESISDVQRKPSKAEPPLNIELDSYGMPEGDLGFAVDVPALVDQVHTSSGLFPHSTNREAVASPISSTHDLSVPVDDPVDDLDHYCVSLDDHDLDFANDYPFPDNDELDLGTGYSPPTPPPYLSPVAVEIHNVEEVVSSSPDLLGASFHSTIRSRSSFRSSHPIPILDNSEDYYDLDANAGILAYDCSGAPSSQGVLSQPRRIPSTRPTLSQRPQPAAVIVDDVDLLDDREPSDHDEPDDRPIDERLFSYIQRQDHLYSRILRYEPLDFESLHAQVVLARGLEKCSRKALGGFLDSKAINYVLPTKPVKPGANNRRRWK
ncbi:hypothetical protein HKX48_002673 [Thoreauomyces humboldtii]|nr:hypothetical protein HKX48_002673 [Thoreauomyces humboldtii]